MFLHCIVIDSINELKILGSQSESIRRTSCCEQQVCEGYKLNGRDMVDEVFFRFHVSSLNRLPYY